MKQKRKTLGILVGVLLILLGVFFGMKQWNASQKEAKKQEEEAAIIHIFEADELKKMSYENVSTEETMAFKKEDDTWLYCEDTTIGLMEDTMKTMEDAFSDITAVKEIKEPDELSDYGFDSPQYRLTLAGEDEAEHLFLIGSTTNGNYYFMEDGQETVYTVEAALTDQMIWEIASIAQMDSFVTVTEENFVKEVVTSTDGTETVFEAESEDQKETVTSITGALAGFYFTDCADYHVTDETLGDYGLDEANRFKVVLTYQDTSDDGKEKEITFYVGSMDETGTYYYVQLNGSQMVNRVIVDTIEKSLGWVVESSEE